LSLTPVAFDDRFYGFSTAGHPEAELLASYLFLIMNSNLALYKSLLCSGVFASSRNVIQLHDLEMFPMISPESLTKGQRHRISSLVGQCQKTGELPQSEIDDFMAELHGLTEWDNKVVLDTLDVGLPFSSEKERAEQRPSDEHIKRFVDTVSELLSSVLTHQHRKVVVARIRNDDVLSAWIPLVVRVFNGASQRKFPPMAALDVPDHIWDVARDKGVSRVIVTSESDSIIVGVFAQYRYWTETRARMLALDLLGDPDFESVLRGVAE